MDKNDSNNSSIRINPNKLYKIETKLAPGLVIEFKKGIKKEGTPIILGKSSDVSYQFFKIKKKDEGHIIESLSAPGYVIDVLHSKMIKENKIQLYPFNGTNAQVFNFIDAGNGYISILSMINQNFCLDVPYSKASEGTKIWLWTRNNTDAQKFKLIGINFINQSIEYARTYALKRNPEYEEKEDNSTNFCSQCLVAGGIDQDDIWKKGEETFYESNKFKQYFIGKNIEWKENPLIDEIKPGDIIFSKDKIKFPNTMFVMRTSAHNVVYCSNSKDFLEEYFDLKDIEGVLKTSYLYK